MIANVHRILVVTPWYSETETGGVAIASQNLVAALRTTGLEVTVLVPQGSGWLTRTRSGVNGETVVYLPMRSKHTRAAGLKATAGYYLRLPGFRRALKRLARRFRFQLVHFNFSTEEYDEFIDILERMNTPMIATFHGSEVAVAYDWVPLGAVTKRLVRAARRVVLVSQALRKTLADREPGLHAKFRVIYNCAPSDVWALHTPDAATANRDVDILYLGGLLPVKGPDILLEAYRIVHDARPLTRAVIVGDGPLRAALENTAAESDWSARVTFTGRVPRDEVLKWYRRARIVVLPSRSEGLPLVAVEASLSGAALVATRVGGIPEVVLDGETGALVPPEDPAALASAMLKLLDQPQLVEAAGDRARAHARTLFSPEAMANAYLTLYGEVLAESAATTAQGS